MVSEYFDASRTIEEVVMIVLSLNCIVISFGLLLTLE